MKRQVFFFIALLFCFRVGAGAQSITFSKPGHINQNDKLSISIGVPLGDDGSSEVTQCIFFLNGTLRSLNKVLSIKSPPAIKFIDSLVLKNETFNSGIHSFYFHFPDTTERLFSCFVSGQVAADAINLQERPTLAIDIASYNALVAKIKDLLTQGDGTALLAAVPAGLKSVAIIDFFSTGLNGFDNPADSVRFAASQYKFAEAPIPGNSTQNFNRDFLQENVSSPFFALLSGGWQLLEKNFKGSITTLRNEILAATSDYEILHHVNTKVDDKIQFVLYQKAKSMHRIMLFIDN